MKLEIAKCSHIFLLFHGLYLTNRQMWDFNGHCYHTMKCQDQGQSTDISQILSLKRNTLAVGWTRYVSCVQFMPLFNPLEIIKQNKNIYGLGRHCYCLYSFIDY